jgi:hypothetical protein
MSIIKSLVCAVIFVVQAINAELYVNCMAAPDAAPNAADCTDDVRQEVLDMLGVCTGGLATEYVGPPARRHLRSGEQPQSPREAEQSKRDLQDGCRNPNLNEGQRANCCMMNDPDDPYSYCGRSGRDCRRLQLLPALTQSAMTLMAEECTNAFRVLANATNLCFGSPEDVFCKTLEILMG